MTVDKELKRKITERWHILAGGLFTAREATAYAQLEYILIEAGLLARTRKRRNFPVPVLADQSPITGKLGNKPEQGGEARESTNTDLKRTAREWHADSRGGENLIDDNTIGLSEEVARNYGE